MHTILTIASLILAALALTSIALGHGGIIESLGRLRGLGTRLSLLGVLLLTVGALTARAFITLDEEAEKRIARGTEPGDTISTGFDTKARFLSQSHPLGRVVDRNGLLLAGYVNRDGHLKRYYPAGAATAHIVGYWTGPIRDGVGVEKGLVYLNDSLRDDRPHDVALSLDLRLQADALKALGGRNGAVVVLNSRTGEVLAAASTPSYDPNVVASDSAWKRYASDEIGRPLTSRALRDDFSPGSSIKPLVAAAALTYDTPLPEEEGFSCVGTYTPGPGIRPITDHGSSHGRVTLASAMRVSCNTYFSHLAYGLVGFDRMQAFLEDVGANETLLWNTNVFLNRSGALRLSPSRVEAADEIARSRVGIGQASVKLNPLHAAVIYGGIAEGGLFLRPRLERDIPNDTLAADTTKPDAPSWALSAVTAERIAEVMLEPLKPGGTASGIFNALKGRGITVYGKTGTADREPDGRAPSWFSSFAEKGNRRYVVIVVIENRRGSYAGDLNAPIARAMYEALEKYGYFRE